MTILPAFLGLAPGASGSLTIQIDRTLCGGEVTINFDALAGFHAGSAHLSESQPEASVTVSADLDAPSGPYALRARAQSTAWFDSVSADVQASAADDVLRFDPDVFFSSITPYGDGFLVGGMRRQASGLHAGDTTRPLLARLTSSGSIDLHFGDQGFMELPFSGGVAGMAVDHAGDVEIALGVPGGWCVVRLHANGTLDERAPEVFSQGLTGISQGEDGHLLISTVSPAGGGIFRVLDDGSVMAIPGTYPNRGRAFAAGPDAFIWVEPPAFGEKTLQAQRFDLSGSADASYRRVIADCGPEREAGYEGATVDPQGRLLWAMQCWEMDTFNDVPLVRTTTEGFPDSSFRPTNYTVFHGTVPAVFDADGSLLVGSISHWGVPGTDEDVFALKTVRVHSDGTPDEAAGPEGVRVFEIGYLESLDALARHEEGSAVLALASACLGPDRPRQFVVLCVERCD